MNKLLKGSIAGAAGIVLLLGGAGTFAVWNAADTVEAGTVTAGNLLVELQDKGVWTQGLPGALTTQPVDITKFRIVPGDVFTFTQVIKVTAEGDNLEAELGLTEGSITALAANDIADEKLVGDLFDNVKYTLVPFVNGVAGSKHVPSNDLGVVTYSPDAAAISEFVTITATITFPFETFLNIDEPAAILTNLTKQGAVTLENFSVTLTQVPSA
jgi:alternate signal-mediated exported protein